MKIEICTESGYGNINIRKIEYNDILTVYFKFKTLDYTVGKLNKGHMNYYEKIRFIHEKNSIFGNIYYVDYLDNATGKFAYLGIVELENWQHVKLQFFNFTLPKVFSFFKSREIWCFIIGYLFDEFKFIIHKIISLI